MCQEHYSFSCFLVFTLKKTNNNHSHLTYLIIGKTWNASKDVCEDKYLQSEDNAVLALPKKPKFWSPFVNSNVYLF